MRITRFLHSISQVVGKLVLFSIAVACAGAAVTAQEAEDYGIESDGRSPGDSAPVHGGASRQVLMAIRSTL